MAMNDEGADEDLVQTVFVSFFSSCVMTPSRIFSACWNMI